MCGGQWLEFNIGKPSSEAESGGGDFHVEFLQIRFQFASGVFQRQPHRVVLVVNRIK